MLKRNINELTPAELRAVFHQNDKLQANAYDDYCESEMWYISEVLDAYRPGLRDWSIGFGNSNYITPRTGSESDIYGFFEAAQAAQTAFCFLPDEYTPRIANALEKANTLYCMAYDNKQYDNLCAWLEREAEAIADEITATFNLYTSPRPEDIEEYFVDFYAAERIPEAYANENGTLYEDISYTKCYSTAASKGGAA